ncbi:LSm family protein [Millionella massiliensis]|uniref:hypothetical protein n=1 Tax=Millionella massiliensis TaxID=1871023 RepID=UPI0009F686DF|nr:hypothetical protein [Millionella massiliensis]
MDTKAIIRDTVATVVEGENSAWAEKGFFVVDVLCKGAAGDEIEVSLDCDGEQTGVGIEDCAQISREIGERLVERLPKTTVDGVEQEADFSLTVMSAGLGQPLRLGRQYQKLMRRALERESLPRVDVLFKDGRKLNGAVLCGIGYGGGDADCPSAIEVMYEVKELLPGKKRKELVEKHEQIALEETKAVTEYFEFK